MHYTKMLRCTCDVPEQVTVAAVDDKPAILGDDDVAELLETLKDFHKKYFEELPLSRDLYKNFVYNVPKEVIRGMRDAVEFDLPDVMNPAILLYPFLSVSPDGGHGLYLSILFDLMKQNMDFIEHNRDEYMGIPVQYNVEEEDENVGN